MPTATPKPTRKPTPTPAGEVIDGITYYNGFADPRTIDPEPVPDPASLIALVNKFHALPGNYVPDLVTVSGTSYRVRPEANAAWVAMQADCKSALGATLKIVSAYRSYNTQADIFDSALIRKGIVYTICYNAYPGRSEHQLGLAIDVNDGSNTSLRTAFADTASYQWLTEHAHEYGFILRYPSGREADTGYAFEPWHYRYVGIEAAKACHDNGWILEEYIGQAG